MEQPFGVVFAVAFVALEVSLVSFLPSEPVAVRNLYFCSKFLRKERKEFSPRHQKYQHFCSSCVFIKSPFAKL